MNTKRQLVPNVEFLETDTCVEKIKTYLLDLQNRITAMLETEDGQAKFLEDEWQFKDKGGGKTRILSKGVNIEKAGVNFSHVAGNELPKAATLARPELANAQFQALGISVVVHPINPYAPTTHMNVRFIVVERRDENGNEALPHWWFGGGFDLTPYYGFDEDCVHWHSEARAACEPFGDDVYTKFKKWCDQYFYLAHRQEPRGIGGLFFDDLNQWGFAQCFRFMQSVGDHFITAFQPILARRKNMQYGERERNFQLYRRGRYVEFNLLYDRGTLFGIQSGGRTESILMSLPPLVAWEYNFKPDINSAEEKLYQQFLISKDWL